MADPQTDAAIAALWPEAWAKANNPALRNRSKARQQIRQRYKFHLEMDALQKAKPHARCGVCKHYEPVPHSSGGKFHCSIESDFHGYQITTPDNLCLKFKGIPNQEPTNG